MEQLDKLPGTAKEAGAIPASFPLEAHHDDLDILNGCPRTLKIHDVPVTIRAFKNQEYTHIATLLLWYGFRTCETPDEVDEMTIADIYNNIAFNAAAFGMQLGVNSLEEFLYQFMEFPEGIPRPEFADSNITKSEYEAFLAMVIEQNNLMKQARRNAKKNLEARSQT